MEIFIIIGVILFFFPFVYPFYLSSRIKMLENEVAALKSSQTPPMQSAPAPVSPAEASTPVVPVSPPLAQANQNLGSGREQNFIPTPAVQTANVAITASEPAFDPIAWLKQDFFVKLGALLLLLAFGWFVSYAFANNWVGPAGRISLGLLAGVLFMALGVWRIRTRSHQGSIFTVLGSTVVLLTIFAARELYDFFTPTLALGVMFMSVAFVAFVAVWHRKQNIAVAGLILGAIAPLLTNTPEPSTIGLFSYLLVLVLGSLWILHKIEAVAMPVCAFLIVSFYATPYLFGSMSDTDVNQAVVFAFGFTLIFFVSNIASMLKRSSQAARQMHVLVALGTGLYIASWIGVAIDPVWHSLLFAAWALLFAVGAFVVFSFTTDRVPFYIYSAVGVGLLAAATAAELDGPILTIAYSVEAAVLMLAAGVLFKDYTILKRLSVIYIGPGLLSIEHMVDTSWNAGFMHADAVALFALLVSLLISALVMVGLRPTDREITFDTASTLTVAAGFYAMALVWLTTHSVLMADTATTISLFIYTVVGIGLYVYGHSIEKRAFTICGGILIGLVVARLLLIDVWSMDLTGRIITFFVIGLLLISTAFINKFNQRDT